MIRSVLFALLAACGPVAIHYPGDDGGQKGDNDAPGTIQGRACGPSSRTWAADAVITARASGDVADAGTLVVTHSDADGRFTLENLVGDAEHILFLQWGEDTAVLGAVYVRPGETVVLAEPDCLDPFMNKVLVVTGPVSGAALALEQAGVTEITLVDGQDSHVVTFFLDSPEALGAYDLVVFEGGFIEADVIHDVADPENAAVAARMQNLRDYVAAGGRVLATDTAYDVVEIGWPNAGTFVGADSVPDSAQLGNSVTTNAVVADASLNLFLGQHLVELSYDRQWPPVMEVAEYVSVLLKGNVDYSVGADTFPLNAVPLLYRFWAGEGGVTYATFRLTADADPQLVETLRYVLHTM